MNSKEHTKGDSAQPRSRKWRFGIRAAVAAAPLSIFLGGMPAALILDYLDMMPKGRMAGSFWIELLVLNIAVLACIGFIAGLVLDVRAHGLRKHRVAVALTLPPVAIVLVAAFFHIPILRAGTLHFLKHERVEYRWEAAYGLQWLNGHARPAVPEILAALDDDDPRVRWHLATALSHCIQPGGTDLVKRLVTMYETDPSAHVRWHLAQLLMRHNDEIPPQLQEEIMMLQRPEESIWGYGGGRGR